jgi:hypothetical protein
MSLRDSLRLLRVSAENTSKRRASIFLPENWLSLLAHPQAAVAISDLRHNGLFDDKDIVLQRLRAGLRVVALTLMV